MFCTKCGFKVEEGERFCSECGAPLKQEAVDILVKSDEVEVHTEEAAETEVAEEVTEEAIETEVAAEVTEEAAETEVAEEVTEETIEAEVAAEVTQDELQETVTLEGNEDTVGVGAEAVVESEAIEALLEAAPTTEVESATAKPKKKKKWLLPVILVSVLLALIIAPVVGMVVYCNVATYDYRVPKGDLKTYLEENATDVVSISDGRVDVTIPEELINIGINESLPMLKAYLGEDIECESAYYNVKEGCFYSNAKYKGMNVPVSAQISLDLEDAKTVKIENIKLGAMPLPSFVKKMMTGKDEIVVDLGTYIPEFFVIEDLDRSRDEYSFSVTVDYKAADRAVKEFKTYMDQDMIEMYKTIGGTHYDLAMLMDSNNTDKKPYIDALLYSKINEDFITQCLALLNDSGISKVKTEYQAYLGNTLEAVDEEDIKDYKEEMTKMSIATESQEVFDALDAYLSDYYVYPDDNQGLLYDTEGRQLIDIAELKTSFYLNQDNNLFNDSLITCDSLGEISILYQKEDMALKIKHDGTFVDITVQDIEQIKSGLTGPASEVSKSSTDYENILAAISSYTSNYNEMNVRHMKADSKYAFVILSYKGDDNNLSQYVLEKAASGWSVLGQYSAGEYVAEYAASTYPAINWDVLPTDEVANHYLQVLSINDYDTLRNIIANNTGLYVDEVVIDYAAMADNIVSIELNNGRDFIYYNMSYTLQEVYSYEDVLNEMSTVYDPPMFIFLQP